VGTKTDPYLIKKLRAESATLKSRLDEVNARLQTAIGGKTPSKDLEPLSPEDRAIRRRRVLIIEDETEERELLAKLVNGLGHSVECAANGVDGLVAIQDFRPHVAFIDLGLPDLDGYSIARRVRAAYGDARPLLVAYTAYEGNSIRAAAIAAGFDRHVLKPVPVQELVGLVQLSPRKPRR
jgi:CheY-like chemotaxis protein